MHLPLLLDDFKDPAERFHTWVNLATFDAGDK